MLWSLLHNLAIYSVISESVKFYLSQNEDEKEHRFSSSHPKVSNAGKGTETYAALKMLAAVIFGGVKDNFQALC